MKKTITSITEKQAKHITRLLGVKYSHRFGVNLGKKIVTIGVDTGPNMPEETIYIYPTGKISHFFNNGEPGGSGYRDINPLPVTDYLRTEGFLFKY